MAGFLSILRWCKHLFQPIITSGKVVCVLLGHCYTGCWWNIWHHCRGVFCASKQQKNVINVGPWGLLSFNYGLFFLEGDRHVNLSTGRFYLQVADSSFADDYSTKLQCWLCASTLHFVDLIQYWCRHSETSYLLQISWRSSSPSCCSSATPFP